MVCITGFYVFLKRTVVVDNDRRFDNLSGSHLESHVNCLKLLAVESQVSDWCVSIRALIVL